MKRGFRRQFSLLTLAIESSCDDSAVALVRERNIVGCVRFSQIPIHQKTDGIVPFTAANWHRLNVPIAVTHLLNETSTKIEDVKLVAVTRGPGLAMSLVAGCRFAHAVGVVAKAPVIGIHHMAGHALIGRMLNPAISFPFLCLLVSGGHTMIVEVHSATKFAVLASTEDDSVGEALDKGARYLKIGWHPLFGAAAALEATAAGGDEAAFSFTRPFSLKDSPESLRLSFSGLKSAFRRHCEQQLPKAETNDAELKRCQRNLAASYQKACFSHLLHRLERVLKQTRGRFSHLVVSGGVACNLSLREKLKSLLSPYSLEIVAPPPELCTDNAVMIGWCAQEALHEKPCRAKHSNSAFEILSDWNLHDYSTNVEVFSPFRSSQQ